MIKVKYLRDILELEKHGDWIDLRAGNNVSLKAGEYTIIPLGVAIKLPTGYEAHIVPRSSTFKNYGVIQTNGIGIIDSNYCGNNDEWGMPVYATRDTLIHKNDRICQFRIMKVQDSEDCTLYKVDHLNDLDRGGFGSSGVI